MFNVVFKPFEDLWIFGSLLQGIVTVHNIEVAGQKGFIRIRYGNWNKITKLLIQLRVLFQQQRGVHLKEGKRRGDRQNRSTITQDECALVLLVLLWGLNLDSTYVFQYIKKILFLLFFKSFLQFLNVIK